jgi:phosphoglycolate phosphatase
MIPAYKAYIFDVDGTLVDSAEDICGAIQGALASTDQKSVPFNVLRSYIGRHLDDLFADLFPDYTAEQKLALVENYRKLYPARDHAGTRAYPNAVEAISKLHGKKSTATTKGTPTTRVVLERFGFLPYFDHVQGTDGFPAKPHPDVLFKAVEGLGVEKADCLFVGDSAADMEAAHRAGMASCAVSYGYGDRESMARWKPDYWVDNLLELLPFRS